MDIGTSAGLALSSGINAYLPMLAFALYAQAHHDKIDPHFAFVGQNWFIYLLAFLAVLDLAADKIPGLDHVWDAVHTVIRPIAGAVVSLVSYTTLGAHGQVTDLNAPIALLAGGVLAGMTHVTKATVRVGSTAFTAGCANAFLSIGEDIAMVIGTLLALFAPYVMLVVVIIAVTLFLLFSRKLVRTLRNRRARRAARVGPPPGPIVDSTTPYGY